MLLHVPEVLGAAEVLALRDELAHAHWVDGRDTAGAQARQAKRNRQVAADCPRLPGLQQRVLAALDGHSVFFSAALPRRVLPPLFNRYEGEANTYGPHVDQAVRALPGTGERLRADLSCTLFLSDPAHYDGGALVVDEGLAAQAVRLPAGDLLLYPSTHVHRVEPVTRGARLAAFFWIESMVRDTTQRRLLFELDMALMRLRQRHGESPETVALMGTYHNLLRQWAHP